MYTRLKKGEDAMKLAIPGVALMGLFALNLTVGMYYGVGVRHDSFFSLMHLLGGFFVAMLAANIVRSGRMILAALLVVTVGWEFLEYLIVVVPAWKQYVMVTFRLERVAFEWGDNLADSVLNFTGAALFLFFRKRACQGGSVAAG